MNPLEDPTLFFPIREKDRPKRWKWNIEGLTYFNRKPRNSHRPIVDPVPLSVETIESAFVSGMTSPILPPGTYSGAVYRSDRNIVSEFREYDELTQHRVPKRVNAPVIEQSRIDDAVRIDRTSVYLGPLATHFGHFLLESLPRAWYLKEAGSKVCLLFHGRNERAQLPSFAVSMLDALGASPSQIRIVSRDVIVTKLILPTSQFWQGIKASPGMCVIFDRIREKVLMGRRNRRPTPGKVYLTRRGIGGHRANGSPRAVISNEDEAEALFLKKGYEIVRPETLPFEEQVAIVANATHVAGPSGSALHLMLFNDNPRTKLIELRTKPAVNQLLISAIRSAAAFHIWSATNESSPERTVLDLSVVERAVQEIDG